MFHGADDSEERLSPERRAARRYPVALHLQYRAFRNTELFREGLGRTMNMSSAGILFRADAPLEQGLRLEVSIAWPSADQRSPRLQLVGAGEIVRSCETEAAVRIRRHEFRVAARTD
jgi:hypothetical protein